ncbi:MAG: esterase [Bacteroidetes bacterium]|nr:MAG: esterase [Bacteroidota bacterium]
MKLSTIILAICICFSCKGVKQQQDEIYSRHLQRKVQLTIIHTPVPSDKSELNLLLLNDGQDLDAMRIKEITDSLYNKGRIRPLVIVGIHAGDRMQEYGVADKPDYAGRGSKAVLYDRFVDDELYPFVKKRATVRKFNSVAIAGWSLGGLSAFDIAWNHPEKIDKVGVFSGSFWWRDKSADDSSYSDEKNRIVFSKLRASRKKPDLQFWFYAGTAEENSDRDKDGIIDVVDDTKDLIQALEAKNIPNANSIIYKEVSGAKHEIPYWSAAFPEFLIWAFGK